jgi:hypothetical protein
MAESSSDPLALWQKMIGEMEKGFGAFANQAMASSQFSKPTGSGGSTTAGAHTQLGELMETYLLTMNLPSRTQMAGMAAQLQSIEAQLNEIKTLLLQMNAISGMARDSVATAPKPPRVKRPAPPPPKVQKQTDAPK